MGIPTVFHKEVKMYATVNKGAHIANITFNLQDENDRQIFIHWLKQVQPATPEAQFDLDRCILAAGGEPEPSFPNYELFQQ
jgi:hypothetical protein